MIHTPDRGPELEVKACPNGCGVSIRAGNQTWCLELHDAEELSLLLSEHLASRYNGVSGGDATGRG